MILRNLGRIAAFGLSSIAIGAVLAVTIPTDMRAARNSQLDLLSHQQITAFPGAKQAISGPDSYPVVYSPQYQAVVAASERARLQQRTQPEANMAQYDPPTGIDRETTWVHRTAGDDGAPAVADGAHSVTIQRAATSVETASSSETE